MNNTFLTIVFVLFVTAIFSLFSLKQKKDAWTGQLIKKKFIEGDDSQDQYKLIFKTDTGKTKRMSVNKAVYDTFLEGDKVEKISGQYLPTKI